MLLTRARLSSQGICHRSVRVGLVESTSSIFYPDILEDIPTKHNYHQNKSQVDPTNLYISESDTSENDWQLTCIRLSPIELMPNAIAAAPDSADLNVAMIRVNLTPSASRGKTKLAM
jgi:hypothetical protein